MRLQRAGYRKGGPPWCAAAPDAARRCWEWNSWCAGPRNFKSPGVCISFEESPEELSANVASLGFDIDKLIAQKKLAIDFIYLERSLIEEAGDYDLEARFIRLGHAVDSIGAKRVLLDSIEALFAGLENESVLRSELRRLSRRTNRDSSSPKRN